MATNNTLKNTGGLLTAVPSNGNSQFAMASGNTWVSSSHTHTIYNDATTGDLRIDGDVIFKGTNLEQRLLDMERALAMPVRDRDLERKHPALATAFESYIDTLITAIPELMLKQQEYEEAKKKFQNWESLKK
jgi:hypothetical protein